METLFHKDRVLSSAFQAMNISGPNKKSLVAFRISLASNHNRKLKGLLTVEQIIREMV